ncbi:M1 family metallopeptidase [Sediminibacterium sp.]|uniref:M1 family metallopeptidase n=1 Tax=Sediminibacterium sp. TaxID=1917865 RepID=UPI0025D180E0|nr:M1 family metallopeptidase [Sediminibacterium sp.]MBW0177283.1 M1 family metallopeptidase [Sediminibacterium sp.]
MKHQLLLTLVFSVCTAGILQAQNQRAFTKTDSLRGTITPERAWWNLTRYDLEVQPDYLTKTLKGVNTISYTVVENNGSTKMQIDLKDPLKIDEVKDAAGKKYSFKKEGSVWLIDIADQKKGTSGKLSIHYSGTPHEAIRAPWDGGWTFTKDSLGRPWMTVTCQGGAGASIWYPCKDHQSDEPDKGASLTMRVPDTLMAIGNGRLKKTTKHGDGTTSYRWEVINPINNYNIIPYIGKYINFKEVYQGEKGKLDLNYWVLDYNEQKAKNYLPKEVHNTMKSFEYWFGPYPFYEDGYQLIDVPHTGMEHQSAVAYGNWYQPGYRKRDGSGTGWGLKWDFIVIHESGHEWFGNNITSKDLADMWVHEGFTNYSETLFVDYIFGEQAGNEYNAGIRRGIRNDKPIIPTTYGVNAQGSGDMYPKGGNLLHAIKHSMNDSEKFRQILRGLNKDFYHQTVTSAQVENYISEKAGFDYSKVFDQYLRNTAIPKFEFEVKGNTVRYRYTNCIPGFNLPVVLTNNTTVLKLLPTDEWATTELKANELLMLTVEAVKSMYYIDPVQIK